MSGLIDGLPDAVTLQCLARVPFILHPQLQLVCHAWRSALRSPELFKLRNDIGATEELLCVSAFEPENVWQVYDPVCDMWMTLPPLPSEIKHLTNFGAVSVAGKLFVLGGGSDDVDPVTGDHGGIFATDEVWAYDPVCRKWARRAAMLVARAMFACCVLDRRIIVAGGFTNFRRSISSAEIYDPDKDVWEPIPALEHTHNSVCSGLVYDGKLHVLHKGLSKVQIFESSQKRWVVEDYGWLPGPMAVVKDELLVVSNGLVIREHKISESRKNISSASACVCRIGFGMIGLGHDLYFIGGVIGPGRSNLALQPLSDVDVLRIKNERPVWHQAKPMTLCRGTIVGCTVLRI
uniref:F-box domain-containing protein n=1 Tax=Araucaria cunninghamii TaxID=56994 RepID=A0A0D6R6E9_ARACU